MSVYKSISPNLALQYFREGQADAELTVNDLIAHFDQYAFISVLDSNEETAPSSPSDGDTYLIPFTPSPPAGTPWYGKSGSIAWYNEGTLLFVIADAYGYDYWEYLEPTEGIRLYIATSDRYYVRTHVALWIRIETGAA